MATKEVTAFLHRAVSDPRHCLRNATQTLLLLLGGRTIGLSCQATATAARQQARSAGCRETGLARIIHGKSSVELCFDQRGSRHQAASRTRHPGRCRHDPLQRQVWWQTWTATDEGTAWTAAREEYEQAREAAPYITATVDRDGSFRIDDMPTGNYVLSVRFNEHSTGSLAGYRFEVPDGDASEPVDLGTLTLK